MSFKIRLATSADVRRLSELRLAVLENVLRFRNSVTLDHYLWFVTNSEVWVADVNGHIAGFSAADPRDGSIFALFIEEQYHGRGWGRALLAAACATLIRCGHTEAKLTTMPGTRAEGFYRALGWIDAGASEKGEIIFRIGL